VCSDVGKERSNLPDEAAEATDVCRGFWDWPCEYAVGFRRAGLNASFRDMMAEKVKFRAEKDRFSGVAVQACLLLSQMAKG
jgi:hypothetical protein